MNDPHHRAIGTRLVRETMARASPTVHSREQIVDRVVAGQTAAEVAAALAVSVRKVRKWLARLRAGGQACWPR
ncbi:MAG: hypothetical protein C0524_01980 [Rhodobacter sp.]|nr:hypothetical protein [Rhodobacter sp.]